MWAPPPFRGDRTLSRDRAQGASHVQHDTGRAVSEARLQLRADLVLSTLAVVKEVAEPEVLPATSVAPDPQAPIPKQIRYIIGNEGCERFSFYGMRNILTVFLVSSLLLYLPEARTRPRREGCFSHVRHRRLFFSVARRLAGRSFLRQIQHHFLAEPGLLRRVRRAWRCLSRTARAFTSGSG